MSHSIVLPLSRMGRRCPGTLPGMSGLVLGVEGWRLNRRIQKGIRHVIVWLHLQMLKKIQRGC